MDQQDYTGGGAGSTSGGQTAGGEQRIVVDLENPTGSSTGGLGGSSGGFGGAGQGAGSATGTRPSGAGQTGAGQTGGGQGGASQSGGSQGGIGGALGTAQDKVNQGMRQAADGLESAAQRLDSAIDGRMGNATGRMAQAGQLGHSFADTMESVAGYLRNNDVDGLRRDLERQMRERPLQTLLVGVAAGWLAGKILR